MNQNLDAFSIVFLSILLFIAVINDIRFQKIPNLLTYSAMFIALICHASLNGIDGLKFSAGGLGLGIAVLIIPYLMEGMGAGDVKLMGAVGAILGPKGVFVAFVFSAIAGGIYAIALLAVYRKECRKLLSRIAATFKTFILTGHFIPIPAAKDENKPRLRYAIAIALGTFFYILLEYYEYNFPI
ncbi:MAG: A24 family peptidase [Candidatus Methanoperedenaceae archaeon]|nr:A24 family peptidase [Candidatus Methanoperedenaceae archaeon]